MKNINFKIVDFINKLIKKPSEISEKEKIFQVINNLFDPVNIFF
jgi:hypothetical protein